MKWIEKLYDQLGGTDLVMRGSSSILVVLETKKRDSQIQTAVHLASGTCHYGFPEKKRRDIPDFPLFRRYKSIPTFCFYYYLYFFSAFVDGYGTRLGNFDPPRGFGQDSIPSAQWYQLDIIGYLKYSPQAL